MQVLGYIQDPVTEWSKQLKYVCPGAPPNTTCEPAGALFTDIN